jgi:hypothetical protein
VNQPTVTLRFDGNGRACQPGQTLSGEYRLESIERNEIRAVEVSVLWHTDGKGDEDLAVHHFQRLSAENGDWIDPRYSGRFSTTLPNSPLSYDGVIVKLRWCVRVRVFLSGGREVMGELPFQLGDVPAAKAAPP